MAPPGLRGLRIAAVVTVALFGSLAAGGSALADVTGTGGGAYIASATLTGFTPTMVLNVNTGPLEQVTAPAPPIVTSPTTNALALLSADITALQAAYTAATAGTSSGSTSGATGSATLGPTGAVTSAASLTNVSVTTPLTASASQLTATAVASICTATGAGASGSTTIANGVFTTGVTPPLALAIAPAPNTTIPIAFTSGNTTVSGTLVLNEQTVTNALGTASITVNAIHPTETATQSSPGFPTLSMQTLNVVLGHSACTVTGSDVVDARFRSLEARPGKRGVEVSWRTASQINVAGYNVYREVGGVRVRLNRRLISARSSGRYSFLDHACKAGARYWVQVVNLDGSRSWHGPARTT